MGIMTGYGVKIRQLKQEDVDQFKVDLGSYRLSQCLAVDGEDLGPCLVAVVHFDTMGPELIWSQDVRSSGLGSLREPLFRPDEDMATEFAKAVVLVAATVIPEIND